MQRLPVFNRFLAHLALGRKRAILDVINGGLVDRDHAHPRTGLDGHVADGHSGLHRETTNRFTAKFNRTARAASGTDLPDDGEDNVFPGNAGPKLAIHLHQHVFHFLLNQTLGGEHVLDL